MKRLLIVTALATALLGNAFSIRAADKPAEKPAEAKEGKARPRPFSGKVKAVDKAAKTVTLEGEKAQVFQITSETKIFKERKPATFDDITVGEHISGRIRESADGKLETLLMNVGAPPTRPAKAKEEDKKPENK
jgi:Cu/Ag efflux protein CusF